MFPQAARTLHHICNAHAHTRTRTLTRPTHVPAGQYVTGPAESMVSKSTMSLSAGATIHMYSLTCTYLLTYTSCIYVHPARGASPHILGTSYCSGYLSRALAEMGPGRHRQARQAGSAQKAEQSRNGWNSQEQPTAHDPTTTTPRPSDHHSLHLWRSVGHVVNACVCMLAVSSAFCLSPELRSLGFWVLGYRYGDDMTGWYPSLARPAETSQAVHIAGSSSHGSGAKHPRKA